MATVKGLLVVLLLLHIWVSCLGFCRRCGHMGGPALALVGLNGLCRQLPPKQTPCSALYSGCSHSSFIRSRPTLPPGKRGGTAVAWITLGACAGRPAAPNAPPSSSSVIRKNPLLLPAQDRLGTWKPPPRPEGPARISAATGSAASQSPVPMPGTSGKNLLFNKHTPA